MISSLSTQSQAQSAPLGGPFVAPPSSKVPPEYADAFYWDQAVQSAPQSPLAQQALFLPEPPSRLPAPNVQTASSHSGAIAAIAAAVLVITGGAMALIAWRRRPKTARSGEKTSNNEAKGAVTKDAATQAPLLQNADETTKPRAEYATTRSPDAQSTANPKAQAESQSGEGRPLHSRPRSSFGKS